MEKIYFIILNYNTAEETKGCIDSIKRMDFAGYEMRIIIIDNCSTDDSFEKLLLLYKENRKVELYCMEENVGFSKANNYGYRIVRKRGDAAFCIVCNSDIEFVQQNFIQMINEEFQASQFYVGGPDVFCEARLKTKYKGHQSPGYPYEWNRCYVRVYYQYNKLRLNRLRGIKNSLYKYVTVSVMWIFWKCIIYVLHIVFYSKYRQKRHENLPIHGSCIILSKLFINNEAKLFYPETKFYWEELLLYLRNKKNGYKVVYNPGLKVNHMQGKATNTLKSRKEKELFKYENCVLGAEMYLNELENDNCL